MPTGVYIRSEKCKKESSLRMMGKNKIHGMVHTRFYRTYASMLTRCNNKKFKDHKIYFDKGVKCEWISFLDFKRDMYKSYLKHVEMFGEKQTTLDRINSNGNYCKKNCRWASPFVQSNNRTNNISVTIDGKTRNVAEWARIYNIKKAIIYDRIRKLGWDKIRAVITPKILNN